jgi:hypothetical protein
MNPTLLKSQTVSSLLAGTSRQPIVGVPGPNVGLNALSLAGQALRFERPVSPPHFAVEPVIPDTRTMLPEGLRRSLLRLVTGKLATEHVPLALAHAFDRLRLRPHPFDLPRMDNFVRTYAEQLGATAQYWVRPKDESASQTNSYFDDEILTDENWIQATLERKAAYLEARRSQDRDAGRALLETVWLQLNPDSRLRLLRELGRTLDATDHTFLQILEKDRAPRVRAFAARLLARLGGDTETFALRELLPRLRQTHSGLLRKRAVLALELPATVKEQAAPTWIRDAFGEICFDELARALSLSEADLIRAAAKDANLSLGLALIAISDRRLDLLKQIVVDSLPQAWELLERTGLRDLSLMSLQERLRWATILAEPYGRKPPASYVQWSCLHRLLQQPAPQELIEAILNTDWLEALPDLERQGAAWLELIAALCPSPQRGLLRMRLTSFDPAHTSTALPLLDILDAMENVPRHA